MRLIYLAPSNHSFYCTSVFFCKFLKIFPFCHIEKKKSNISKSLSKPSPSLVRLINQLNNFTEETKDYDENLPNCQYKDLRYFQNFSEKFKK